MKLALAGDLLVVSLFVAALHAEFCLWLPEKNQEALLTLQNLAKNELANCAAFSSLHRNSNSW